MKRTLLLLVICGLPQLAQAQQCENLIALSKTTNTTISDKDAVEQAASNFCSEYSKSGGSSKSASFGASYKFLSASFGSSEASVEQVASRYCSASSNYSQSKDAFKQYIESIAPNAYAAYEQCIRMSQLDISFNLDAASMLPDEFSMTVAFASTRSENKNATVSSSASSGVNCTWDGTNKSPVKLPTGSSTVLHCKRTDQTKAAYVVVARTDGSKESLSIPWKAYSKDGVPIETIGNIQNSLTNLERRVGETSAGVGRMESAPTVTVYKCPDGTNGWNPGGAWGSYGCQGQISTSATCMNIEYPNRQPRDCTPIGKLRLY